METVSSLDGIELNAVDWVETPQSVQELVLTLWAENRELKTRLSLLEEQTKQNNQICRFNPMRNRRWPKRCALVSRF